MLGVIVARRRIAWRERFARYGRGDGFDSDARGAVALGFELGGLRRSEKVGVEKRRTEQGLDLGERVRGRKIFGDARVACRQTNVRCGPAFEFDGTDEDVDQRGIGGSGRGFPRVSLENEPSEKAAETKLRNRSRAGAGGMATRASGPAAAGQGRRAQSLARASRAFL